MYPLKFRPVYQERVWGGTNLAQKYGRPLTSNIIGESWEISAHPNGLSLVENGSLQGLSIPEITRQYGTAFLGTKTPGSAHQKFPLLVKLLDANDRLSVQVHPDDEYALKNEGELGKFEIWYILSAEPGSKIVYGLNPGTTEIQFRKAIEVGNLEIYLHEVEVQEGDVFIIPPGLVHALGAGIMVAEIQQNSDTVYRVFDYNRLDQNGAPRQLHVEKALDVIRFDDFLPLYPVRPKANALLVDSEFFVVDFCENQGQQVFYNDGSRFYILTSIKGQAVLHYEGKALNWSAGESVLLPAAVEQITVNGAISFLKTYLP